MGDSEKIIELLTQIRDEARESRQKQIEMFAEDRRRAEEKYNDWRDYQRMSDSGNRTNAASWLFLFIIILSAGLILKSVW